MPFASVRRKYLKPKETDFEPTTIGEHIQKRRRLLKLTQKAVARLLGVNQASVIHWERGDFQPTRAPTLSRIIQFLGYDPLPADATIPDRLRQKRRRLGWGQQELADQLGVDRCSITDWENGRTVLLRAHRQLIARFTGLSEAEVDAAMRRRWNNSHSRATPE